MVDVMMGKTDEEPEVEMKDAAYPKDGENA